MLNDEFVHESWSIPEEFTPPQPPPTRRYNPLGQHQEQRLIHMFQLDSEQKFYVHTTMADFHLMESLRKRQLVWFTGEDWFLTDAGKSMAEKLNVNDGLPF